MSVIAGQPRVASEQPAAESSNGKVAARQARLAAGIAALRMRSSLSLERVLLIAGSVLIPLGILLILLGWWGVSHSTLQVEQDSYLISGGVLGLALVIAGGFFYFGYWLTRQFYESRKHNERLVTALTAIESRLADQPTGPVAVITQPADPQPADADRNGTPRPQRPLRARPVTAVATDIPMLVATPNGTMLHRPDCPVVANRDGLHRVPANSEGYTPCQICQPLSAE